MQQSMQTMKLCTSRRLRLGYDQTIKFKQKSNLTNITYFEYTQLPLTDYEPSLSFLYTIL